MKKLALLLLIIVLAQAGLFGQRITDEVSFKWSEEITGYKFNLDEIVASNEDGFFNLSVRKKKLLAGKTEFVLEKFDKNAKILKSIPLELNFENNDLSYAFTVETDDNLLIFTSFTNQKQKAQYLFYTAIGKEELKPTGKLIKVSEIRYGEMNFSSNGSFHAHVSKDNSKIAIKTTYYNKKDDSSKFNFQVFDNEMNGLWEKEIDLPFEQDLFDVEGTQLDQDGNIFMSGIEYKEKRTSKRSGEPNYIYHILAISLKGDLIEDIPVTIDAAFITDMRIELNDDQEIICAGFYSDLGTFSNKGSFFLKYDIDTKERQVQKQKEFSMDLIKQTMSERETKKTDKKEKKGKEIELEEYDLERIILREDGGAVLIAEEEYYYVRTSTDAEGRTRSTTYYVHNDILAVNYNPDGSIEWIKKIPKLQTTSSDGGINSSYGLVVRGDKLYFIFNDSVNNLYYKGKGAPERYIRSDDPFVMLVELDADGNQTRSGLHKSPKKGLVLRPQSTIQTSDDEFILIGYKKKVRKFGYVTFK